MKDSVFPSLISGLLCLVFLVVPLPRAAGADAVEATIAATEALSESAPPEEPLPPFDAAKEITLRTAEGLRTLPIYKYLVGVLL